MHQIVNLVYASSSLVLHPVQVAEWSNARVCKTLFRGFKSHPELLFQNRLIGRSTHFDCVCLGSNPSSGTKCPIDGIGIHTCLRSKVLQVRLLYRVPSWIGVTVARRSPKPLVGVQIPHPSPTLLAQWIRAIGYEPMCRRFKSYRGC